MRRFVYLTRTIAFSLVVPPPSEHYLTERGKALPRVMAKSDLYGRAGKNQHAFCLSVGR
jgi:hypothetical protein